MVTAGKLTSPGCQAQLLARDRVYGQAGQGSCHRAPPPDSCFHSEQCPFHPRGAGGETPRLPKAQEPRGILPAVPAASLLPSPALSLIAPTLNPWLERLCLQWQEAGWALGQAGEPQQLPGRAGHRQWVQRKPSRQHRNIPSNQLGHKSLPIRLPRRRP